MKRSHAFILVGLLILIIILGPGMIKEKLIIWEDIDINGDGIIDRAELGIAVEKWINNQITRNELGEIIIAWTDEENSLEYTNPIQYTGEYSFSLDFKNSQIQNLDLFVPLPTTWESQKNTEIISILPEGDIKTDSHNNQYVAYDESDLINNKIVVEEQFNFICYETNFNYYSLDNIQEYDETSDLYQKYTKDESKIETNFFKDVTPEILGTETNPVKQAEIIYDYVIDNLDYSPMYGTLGGARYAYEQKKGECGEYSALFVAMARSVGIPARPVVGFWADPSYGNTHVWAEFYVEGIGWIPADPTIGQQSQSKREYYFGNMDNKRLIMSKNFNINLDGNIADLFQIGAYWWYGSGQGPEMDFSYRKI